MASRCRAAATSRGARWPSFPTPTTTTGSSRSAPAPGSWLAAVFSEPAGQLAGPADGAQAALGPLPDGGGHNDEQPVTGAKHRGRAGDQPLAAAHDQRQVRLDGQSQLEDLYAVQP